jgi:uncharacterized protein (DUF488 family)
VTVFPREPSPPARGLTTQSLSRGERGHGGRRSAQGCSGEPACSLSATQLCTIGYQGTAWAPFLRTLQEAGVRQVLDVRQLPLSRRPGFSKRVLAAGLAEAGIGYVHLRALGTPPEGREANKRREWSRFWPIVEASLSTLEAGVALEQAAGLARAVPSCLLCFEADPCICHRLRVGEMLAEAHGFTLRHLRVPG